MDAKGLGTRQRIVMPHWAPIHAIGLGIMDLINSSITKETERHLMSSLDRAPYTLQLT